MDPGLKAREQQKVIYDAQYTSIGAVKEAAPVIAEDEVPELPREADTGDLFEGEEEPGEETAEETLPPPPPPKKVKKAVKKVKKKRSA